MDDERTHFVTALKRLTSKPCWGVIAGKGTGTMVSFHFGKKTPLAREVRNPHLSEDLRRYEAELVLFVMWSHWAVDAEGVEVCTSKSAENENDGPMVTGLKTLVGRTVEDVSVSDELDLTITLSDGRVLTVFAHPGHEGDNYQFEDGQQVFVVDADGRLTVEASKR